VDLLAFLTNLNAFLGGPWKVLIQVLIVIVAAFVLRFILQFFIRRVVSRIVSGVKKKQNISDTLALDAASPVTTVRIVQRTRALGGVLGSAVPF
jgi:hypothetical protein